MLHKTLNCRNSNYNVAVAKRQNRMKNKRVFVLVGLSMATIGLLAAGWEKTNKVDAIIGYKTLEISGTNTPVGEEHLEDKTEGALGWNQTIDKAKGTYLVIDGTYAGTDYQTMNFGTSSFFRGTAVSGMTSSAIIEVTFNVRGVTSLSYNVEASTTYAYPNFYIEIVDGSSNVLGTTSVISTAGTLTASSDLGTYVKAYFYGYDTFALNSMVLYYNCGIVS